METAPVTDHMLNKIRECHQLALNNIPCRTHHFNNCLEGLIRRGLVKLNNEIVSGKMMVTVSLTDKARELLLK